MAVHDAPCAGPLPRVPTPPLALPKGVDFMYVTVKLPYRKGVRDGIRLDDSREYSLAEGW